MNNFKLWKKAIRKTPRHVRQKDFLPIIVAASVGSVTSTLISKIDFNQILITGSSLVDIILISIFLSAIVLGIILAIFLILEIFDTISIFFDLRKRHKKP